MAECPHTKIEALCGYSVEIVQCEKVSDHDLENAIELLHE